ncbi:MAG: rhodanese-related sulfurtransferase [Candidatus Marivariicella framensis]|jgi:rhodanese-related sulfurtransferase|tara:strand:+ start:1390 stop:1695 length:306 start_codon:yes stop_codon:yes gene_type:complete
MDLSQEEWTLKQNEIKDSIILDVRTTEESNLKRIPNSKLLDIASPSDFMEGLDSMDKKKSYFIYCRSGNRSSQACSVMASVGFDKTYNLAGGIIEWEGETE